MRYRLVNPPPSFTGRTGEQAWLREAIGRAPTVLVYGLGGMGKTSLVVRTLHTDFPERSERVVMLTLTAGHDGKLVLVELLRALSTLGGIEHVDLKSLLGNVETALQTVLDLAEQSCVWVVIDNLHHAPSELSQRLLGTMAAYARKSRWIAVSRVDPNIDALELQCLRLDGMPDADLLALGRLLWPGRSEEVLRCAVAGAGGSPWRMKQLLGGGALRSNPLTGLPPQTDAFVTLLQALSEPLPLRLMARLERVPAPDELAELERLGIVERSGDGYRLHDDARLRLEATRTVGRTLHLRIAEGLSNGSEPRAQLAALRHYCAAGDIHRATELLRAGSEARLLAAGYGRELWSVLAARSEAAFTGVRLRCAVGIGDVEALAVVSVPERAGPAEQLLWAQRHLMLGQLSDALAVAKAVHDSADAAGDNATALEAGLVVATALVQSGRSAEGLECLEALAPVVPQDRTRIDAVRVRCLADLGRCDESVALCNDLRTRLNDLDISTRVEICHQVAIPTIASGNVRLATSIFDLVPYSDADRTLSTHHSQLFLTARAAAALNAGRLHEARQILAKLGPFLDREALLQPAIDVLECSRRVTTGELDGVADLLRGVAGRARDRDDAVVVAIARCLELALFTLLAQPAPDDDLARAYVGVETPMGLNCTLLKLRLDLRLTAVGSVPSMPTLESPMESERALIAEQVFSVGHLVRGELEEAVSRSRRAVAAARRQGHPLHEANSLLLLSDCLLSASRFDEAREIAQTAVAFIEPFGSERLSASAQLAATLARDEPPDPVALERFAELGKVAPDVARRAQALLGAPTCLDAVERRVHQALVARATGQVRTVHAVAGAWRAGWGIDRPRRRAWLPKGRVIYFTTRPLLWRMLETLVVRREATKETLVREVWDERAYHPVHHNNRLFTTVNKLRQLIEDTPARPTRIVTGADSYRLGMDEPVRVLD
ncbi:hypothetical protein WMF11_46120 [Sorangium sp. So ce295]|uniref:hypothetical protein n=1 Tax=Sorangium sp. So ce295 TaxID=3133295 RepID=UPI003F61BFC2